MELLKKLLKWLGVLVAVVALAGLVFVWGVLGVSPIEGDVEELWELVDNDVQFFVRFPGTRLLRSELADGLQYQPGYEFLLEAREQLEDVTRTVAREVNPQVPLELVQVDFEQDFLGTEMAIAGTVGTDYARPKLDNFIVATRIAWYGRFVSALKRDFVRSRIPDSDRIELVKGIYFRYKLDEETARRLNDIRVQRGGRGPIDELYFGRIKDVLLISDEPQWIEAAVRGGAQTLKADPWFETEFIRKSRKEDVEFFMRTSMSANFMIQHGSPERNGALVPLARVIPWSMAGEVTVQASLKRDGVSVRLFNNPPPEGYAKVTKAHLQNLYEREKADLAYDLSENGIGRLIPRQRTVAAAVFHAEPEDLVDLILDYIPRDERELMEDQVRKAAGGRYRDLRGVLIELTKDLEGTHMVVVHRPSAFEGANYTTFKDRSDPPLPLEQFNTFTLVSRVKDSAQPDRVREQFFRHLSVLGFNAKGVHKSGKFHLAEAQVPPPNMPLLQPAYGAVAGTKYVVLADSVEGAEAVFEAATNPDERLLAETGFEVAVRSLVGGGEGTFGLVVRGEGLRNTLWDRVRLVGDRALDADSKQVEWRKKYEDANQRLPEARRKSDEQITAEVIAEKDRYLAAQWPEFRDRYEASLAWLDALDTAALACTLGIGPYKQIEARGHAHFNTVAPDDRSTE